MSFLNPLELSQMLANISESSAVWPRFSPTWDMLIFFGIAPVLFIFNCYKVHLFYKELNSLHRGLKIKHIFNMKVDHICVGTREIQSTTSWRSWRRWACVTLTVSTWHLKTTVHIVWIVNKRQTSAKMLTKYLNYYFWHVRIVQTVILILQHLLEFGCRIPPKGFWRHFQNTTKTRSENCQKLKILPYNVMANFPENIAGSVLHIIECISKVFARVHHCFSHFTVGSSKIRQITIRGLGLNTTNHNMTYEAYTASYIHVYVQFTVKPLCYIFNRYINTFGMISLMLFLQVTTGESQWANSMQVVLREDPRDHPI